MELIERKNYDDSKGKAILGIMVMIQKEKLIIGEAVGRAIKIISCV